MGTSSGIAGATGPPSVRRCPTVLAVAFFTGAVMMKQAVMHSFSRAQVTGSRPPTGDGLFRGFRRRARQLECEAARGAAQLNLSANSGFGPREPQNVDEVGLVYRLHREPHS